MNLICIRLYCQSVFLEFLRFQGHSRSTRQINLQFFNKLDLSFKGPIACKSKLCRKKMPLIHVRAKRGLMHPRYIHHTKRNIAKLWIHKIPFCLTIHSIIVLNGPLTYNKFKHGILCTCRYVNGLPCANG